MDFKNIFHQLLKYNPLIRIAPNAVRFIGEWAMDLKCVTYAYNFLCRYNEIEAKKRESAKKYFLLEREKIEENVSWLSDEQSKEVYRRIIEYRCTGHNETVKKVAEKASCKYLDCSVGFTTKEAFLDVGGFFGETTISVYNRISRLYSKEKIDFSAFVIEPDDYNYTVCSKKLLRRGVKFIAEKCAVGEQCGKAWFSGDIMGSCRFNEDGEKCVEVSTVDVLCQKHGFAPSYIKFDIEGAESEALRGSQEVIDKFRPRLAVSIYHSDKDMVEIIREIKDRHSFYSFYVRHYSGFFAETVLYCIP